MTTDEILQKHSETKILLWIKEQEKKKRMQPMDILEDAQVMESFSFEGVI